MGCCSSRVPAQISNGENLLMRKVTHDYATGEFENLDASEGGFFSTHGRVAPIEDQAWEYVAHGLVIAVQKSAKVVEVDTNFGSRPVSFTIKSKEGRAQEQGISVQAKVALTAAAVKGDFESKLKCALSEGPGEVEFTFSVPCLALRLKDEVIHAERYISAVILGGKINGKATLAGSTECGASVQASVGLSEEEISIGLGGGAKNVRGPQVFDFTMTRYGGPDISTTMQGKTSGDVMVALEKWKKALLLQPTLWQALFVKASKPSQADFAEVVAAEPSPEPPSLDAGAQALPERSPLDLEIPASVHTKLDDPAARLSVDESIACLLSMIEQGHQAVADAKEGDLLCLLGNTGAGKSTLANRLHGCRMEWVANKKVELEGDDDVVGVKAGGIPELMPIGHGRVSKTWLPVVRATKDTRLGTHFRLMDTGGFGDNRGTEINVANSVNTCHCLTSAKTVRVLVLISYYSIAEKRMTGVTQLLNILCEMFGSEEVLFQHCKSICVVISQTPKSENKKTNDAKKVIDKLRDKTGLSAQKSRIMDALVKNTYLYHPMDDGHSSWTSRDALLKIVKQLPPVQDPSSIFKVVLTSTDEIKVRQILDELVSHIASDFKNKTFKKVSSQLTHMLALSCVQSTIVAGLLRKAIETVFSEFHNFELEAKDYVSRGDYKSAVYVLQSAIEPAKEALTKVEGLADRRHELEQRAKHVSDYLIQHRADKERFEQITFELQNKNSDLQNNKQKTDQLEKQLQEICANKDRHERCFAVDMEEREERFRKDRAADKKDHEATLEKFKAAEIERVGLEASHTRQGLLRAQREELNAQREELKQQGEEMKKKFEEDLREKIRAHEEAQQHREELNAQAQKDAASVESVLLALQRQTPDERQTFINQVSGWVASWNPPATPAAPQMSDKADAEPLMWRDPPQCAPFVKVTGNTVEHIQANGGWNTLGYVTVVATKPAHTFSIKITGEKMAGWWGMGICTHTRTDINYLTCPWKKFRSNISFIAVVDGTSGYMPGRIYAGEVESGTQKGRIGPFELDDEISFRYDSVTRMLRVELRGQELTGIMQPQKAPEAPFYPFICFHGDKTLGLKFTLSP